MIKCRILSEESEIEAVAPAWRELHQRIGISPYTGCDEVLLWWQRIGKPSGATLNIVVCFDKDALVGVLPCVVCRRWGTRVLFLLGHDVYYYRAFLVSDVCYVPSLWQTLLIDAEYDIACLKDIHEGTAEAAFLSSVAMPFQESVASLYAHQGETRETLFARYPKSLRRRLRRIEDKIKEGEIEIGFSAFETPPEEVVDFLIQHKTRWAREHDKKGVFAEEQGCAYFKALVLEMGKQKRALMFWIKWKGQLAAATFSIIQKKVVYAHLAAHDPAAAQLGLGMVITAHEIAWAAENGYQETNFMEGDEPYKDVLSNGKRIISDFLIPLTLKGRMYRFLYRLLVLYRTMRRP